MTVRMPASEYQGASNNVFQSAPVILGSGFVCLVPTHKSPPEQCGNEDKCPHGVAPCQSL